MAVCAGCGDDPLPFFGVPADSGSGAADTEAGPSDDASAEVGPGDAAEDADARSDVPDTPEDTPADTDGGSDGGSDGCEHACEAGSGGCEHEGAAWFCQVGTDACRERVPVPCVSGTHCDAGVCGCEAGFCSVRGAGGFCDGLTAVSCADRNGCAVEVARQTCSVACDAGACDCPTNACSSGATGASHVCDGDDRVACEDSGECRVEVGRIACEHGCSEGACVPELCGAPGEACCAASACDSGALCAAGTCVEAPPVQQVSRFQSLCDATQNWSATGACFPGPSATSACPCGDRVVNAACTQETCWAAQSGFAAFATEPESIDFAALYHCFSGFANSYQLATPCSRPGFPHLLGWVATRPLTGASRPVYRCRLSEGDTLVDELLTTSASECARAGRVLVPGASGDAWFWSLD